jgi:hypothetical protein
MDEIPYNILKSIVDFIYDGRIVIKEDDFKKLISTVEKLEINGVIEIQYVLESPAPIIIARTSTPIPPEFGGSIIPREYIISPILQDLFELLFYWFRC